MWLEARSIRFRGMVNFRQYFGLVSRILGIWPFLQKASVRESVSREVDLLGVLVLPFRWIEPGWRLYFASDGVDLGNCAGHPHQIMRKAI